MGPGGPGGAVEDMSPYEVTAMEVATTLGHTDERKVILRSWLKHRAALRALGFVSGFQWLDGSFVEQKSPNDLDIVTFIYRPPAIQNARELERLLRANINVFGRDQVRAAYKLDLFSIDLDALPRVLSIRAVTIWACFRTAAETTYGRACSRLGWKILPMIPRRSPRLVQIPLDRQEEARRHDYLAQARTRFSAC